MEHRRSVASLALTDRFLVPQPPVSPTEVSILTALTAKVPFLTQEQAARTWWDGTPAGNAEAERGLQSLVRSRFLWSAAIEAHPELMLERPLFEWASGDSVPDCVALAQIARRRFAARDTTHVVFLATTGAAKVFGGTPGKLKAPSTTHDLHLAGVYLRLLRNAPEEAERWVSEATLAPDRTDQILPDAALLKPDGRLERVIEFVGSSYPPERLRNVHLDCEAREVPYELC